MFPLHKKTSLTERYSLSRTNRNPYPRCHLDSQHHRLSVKALLPLSPLQRFNLFNYGCSITPRDWNVKKIFDGRFVPPLRWAGGALADRNGVFLTQSHSRTLYIFMDSTADSEPWTVFLATERTAAGGGMWG